MNNFNFRLLSIILVATTSLSFVSPNGVQSHTLFTTLNNNNELISPLAGKPAERLQIRSLESLDAPRVVKNTTTSEINSDNNKQHEENKNNLKISYETRWFTQDIDHFSWINKDSFKQRYLVNQDFWCGKNCPILFYCGNEGDIEVFTNNTGWMWENAQNLHAMLIFAEHRYYGKSIPYNIDPTKVTPSQLDKLGYLSSEQALADYAKLIFSLKNEVFDAKLSPVIAIGGSYGGMLAAWMRMKYPNAIAGALAGSAPIFQFPEEYDCNQFSRIVTKDYENYNANCSISIARSWQVIRDFSGVSGRRSQSVGKLPKNNLNLLGQIFNTCSPMTEADVPSLLQLLNEIWVNMAMTDYANEANFLSKMPAYPIKHSCEYLSTDPINEDPIVLIKNIALASQVYTNYTRQSACLNITSMIYDPMDVMWDFQSCTEMVMPICSDGVNDMFDPEPFNVTDFVQGCKSRWGVQTRPNNIRTMYGDKNLHAASNIIFSSCSRDPWSAGCPQESFENRSIHAIKINGVCHHEDLRASGPNDTQELKKARQDELNIISDWIKEYYDNARQLHANDTLVWAKLR